MTQLLIRLFVRHPDDTKNAAVRTAYGNLASLVGMACNLLLCLGKLAAGTLFGSIASWPTPEQPFGRLVQRGEPCGLPAGGQRPGRKASLRPRPVRISGGPRGLRHHPRHRARC